MYINQEINMIYLLKRHMYTTPSLNNTINRKGFYTLLFCWVDLCLAADSCKRAWRSGEIYMFCPLFSSKSKEIINTK